MIGSSHRRRVVGLLLASGLVVAACASDDSTDEASTNEVSTDEASTDEASTDDTGSTDDGEPEPAGDGAESAQVDDVVLEASVTLEGLSGLTAEAVVSSDQPVLVDVTARSGDHVVVVPRPAVAAHEFAIPIVGLRSELDYEIEIVPVDSEGNQAGEPVTSSVTTESLPDWMPDHDVTVDAERSSPGYTLVETSPPIADPDNQPEGWPDQAVVAYDDEGEIVWWYSNTGSIGGVEQTDAGTFLNHYWPFGIREVDVYGELVGHWRPQPTDADGESVDNDSLVESADPDQIDFWLGALAGNPGDLEPLPVRSEWVDLNGFHHENWPMPNGNILTLSTTIHELTPEQRSELCPDDGAPFNAISDVAVEYQPDGTVVRTWDLWDAVDIMEFPGSAMCVDTGLFAGVSTRDWTHANSVVYDPDRDAILISSRHTDQIVAFDHLDDEGPQTDVRWIIGAGGTIPVDGDLPYHQHAVEVMDDGSIVVYDNGNGRPGTSPENPPYSRAVIYDVDDSGDDPSTWTAVQTWEHIALDDDGLPVFAAFIGDADVLENGNVLITHGGIGAFPADPSDPLHALIIEVDPASGTGGDIVWEFRSDESAPNTSYRAERIESFYVGDEWSSTSDV